MENTFTCLIEKHCAEEGTCWRKSGAGKGRELRQESIEKARLNEILSRAFFIVN
jgi:hypothetical protein